MMIFTEVNLYCCCKQDFATRSLDMTEETPGMEDMVAMDTDDDDPQLNQFQMKRRWETRYEQL